MVGARITDAEPGIFRGPRIGRQPLHWGISKGIAVLVDGGQPGGSRGGQEL